MPPIRRNQRPAREAAESDADFRHAPGLHGALARSPAALEGFLGLHRGLARGRLSTIERRLVGLMVAQRCGSSYCLSMQAQLARKAGLTPARIAAARDGCASSDRELALLFLAGKLVVNGGELGEADLEAVRLGGLTENEVVEVIAHVALHLTAAFVSHAARLKLDFPPAPPLPTF